MNTIVSLKENFNDRFCAKKTKVVGKRIIDEL